MVIDSNTNNNICSKENTKSKARRACKLLFTKKQAKEKRTWSVRRSPIHILCVSLGYEPTPRLFRTRIALLCENDVALASPIAFCLSQIYEIYEQVSLFYHFSKLFFTVSFTMVIKRSPCGESARGWRSTSNYTCAFPA